MIKYIKIIGELLIVCRPASGHLGIAFCHALAGGASPAPSFRRDGSALRRAGIAPCQPCLFKKACSRTGLRDLSRYRQQPVSLAARLRSATTRICRHSCFSLSVLARRDPAKQILHHTARGIRAYFSGSSLLLFFAQKKRIVKKQRRLSILKRTCKTKRACMPAYKLFFVKSLIILPLQRIPEWSEQRTVQRIQRNR